MNLNINLPKDELITAAKVSVGKEQTYWLDLCSKGGGEIFDLEKELLPFIDDPQQYDKQYDAQLRETFCFDEATDKIFKDRDAVPLMKDFMPWFRKIEYNRRIGHSCEGKHQKHLSIH